jgi:type III pantothenate kinase
VDFPEKVGIDRLLNAVAANVLRPAGRGAIIVSAGTATTVDLVTEDGTFAGGAILAGLELGARTLHQYTALLPLVDVPELLQQDQINALGRNTQDAIRSGLWFGQLGAIREIVGQLAGLLREAPLLLITGGNGQRLAAELGHGFQFASDLALRGLAVVARSESMTKQVCQPKESG